MEHQIMPIKPQQKFVWTQALFLLFIAIMPAFLQMCGTEEQVASSQLRMVNGSVPQVENPAYWSAVALVDKTSGEHFCSATLIAPQLVVTAAHCVFDKRPGDFQVLFGASTKEPGAVRRDALAKDTFKKFQKFESNFDIAWVKFDGPIPDGFRPIEIWHQSKELQVKAPLTIAGYGRTSSQCAYEDASCQGGVRLFVDTVIKEFVNSGRLFNLIVIGPRPQHGPCFGDSGGPAYMQVGGKWYLVGDFMGWDRILVPEKIDKICDTGEAIYNFVGDFVSWIEDSSGVKLSYNQSVNPRQMSPSTVKLEATPKNFQEWCAYNNHEDPAWFMVQRLIRSASDFRIKTEDPSKARELFEDCRVAELWIRKMIDTEKSLKLAGFDPASFIDSARIEDIRPLLAFADANLEELILSDHSIVDLSPINQFKHLKKLEIIDNTLPQREGLTLGAALKIGELKELVELRLHNSVAPVDFTGLTEVKTLQVLELSFLHVESLNGLESLPLRELKLDNVECRDQISLQGLTQLKSVFLNKMVVGSLPEQMPKLETLELLETTQLHSLPRDAARLRKLFIYGSDLAGNLGLGLWPNLEEISIMSNQNLQSISAIQDLPRLRTVEIVENKLQSLGSIKNLPKLKTLNVMRNGLSSLPLMDQLPALDKLDLDGNQITELGPFGQLPKLSFLNLSHNPLKDLRGLEGLPGLRRLSIQNQKGGGLLSLEGLANLPKLEELNLAKNSIQSVEALRMFPTLKVLVLSDNSLRDISPLSALAGLEYIELVNNPLDKKVCPTARPNTCRFEWLVFSREPRPKL